MIFVFYVFVFCPSLFFAVIHLLIYAIAMYVLYATSLVANIEDEERKKELSTMPAMFVNGLVVFYLL